MNKKLQKEWALKCLRSAMNNQSENWVDLFHSALDEVAEGVDKDVAREIAGVLLVGLLRPRPYLTKDLLEIASQVLSPETIDHYFSLGLTNK